MRGYRYSPLPNLQTALCEAAMNLVPSFVGAHIQGKLIMQDYCWMGNVTHGSSNCASDVAKRLGHVEAQGYFNKRGHK